VYKLGVGTVFLAFVNYEQRNWPEWLVIVEFIANSEVHTTTKISQFMIKYKRELWIGAGIRKKRKIEITINFVLQTSFNLYLYN